METQTKLPTFTVKEEKKNPNLIYLDDSTMPIYPIRQQWRQTRYYFHKKLNFAIGSFDESVKFAKQFFLENYQIPFESWDYLK